MRLKKIIFRADAGADIGYGHFIRTLALADMLKEEFDCSFATVNPTSYQLEEIGKVCRCIPLSGNTHFDYFLSLLTGDEIVVLDNYFFTTDYQLKIKKKGCLLVCVDDMHDKHYVSDVVINHGLHDPLLFSVEPYTKLCLGYDWLLLRNIFLEKINIRKLYPPFLSKVILCFGGSDSNDFTGKAIRELNVMPSVSEIIAIVGDKYKGLGYVNSPKVQYKHNLSAEEISDFFSYADYAFLSASTVCLEAIACHIPVAAGYYVENQMDFYKELSSLNLVYPLGNLFQADWKSEIEAAFLGKNQMKSFQCSGDVAGKYRSLFHSLFNIRNYQINDLVFIDYRNLNEKQHSLVWKTRNDSQIRCWMENTEPFSLESHCEFVRRLNERKDRLYWSVYSQADFVGSVNISFESETQVERGIFISPAFLNRSLGSRIECALVQLLLKLEVKEISAKVLKTNTRSLQFHLKNGYEIISCNQQYNFLRKIINE